MSSVVENGICLDATVVTFTQTKEFQCLERFLSPGENVYPPVPRRIDCTCLTLGECTDLKKKRSLALSQGRH